jgi:predicted nucleic acid-binding protein
VTSRRFVVDSSPLILLAKIEALELLDRLADEIAIPAAVRAEVAKQSAFSLELGRFSKSVVPNVAVPEEVAGWDLGAGETQVLAFAAAHPGHEAVLDDLEARRCGRSLGVPLTGTLGIILRAKQAGLVEAARPLVDELVRKGAYLSPELIAAALATVGE